jgi:lysophospholipase L1-like esterase
MVLTRPQLDLRWSLWILVPLQIAVTVGLAAASYRWVEMPFRRGTAQTWIKDWMGRRAPRRRLAIVTATAAATLLSGVWLATGSAGSSEHRVTNTPAAAQVPVRKTPDAPVTALDPPLAVGASVMLGSQDALKERLGKRTIVDAAVGRYASDIADRLEAYRLEHALPSRVIVQMGENGPLREEDLARVHAALRGVKRVVLVNVHVPRTWQDDVNNTLSAVRGEWPEAVLANWNAAARPDLLYADGIHPTPEGAQVYAQVIQRALRAPG